MRRSSVVVLVMLVSVTVVGGVFKESPRPVKVGKMMGVAFVLEKPAHVTVTVRDARGKVVRHLASAWVGEGRNPKPFLRGLSQTVLWDGSSDEGKKVSLPCRIEVAVGMKFKLDRVIRWERPAVRRRGILGMAVGPKGKVYVLQGTCWVKVCGAPEITVFSPNGEYLKTIVPFPADMDRRSLPFVEFVKLENGTEVPSSPYPNFVPGLQKVRRQTMLYRRGGLIVVAGTAVARKEGEKPRRRLLRIGTDGGMSLSSFWGPALPGHTALTPVTYLAADKDGRVVYVSGLYTDKWKQPHNVVYRAEWKDEEVKAFVGEKVRSSKSELLDDPRGIALDGKGRLYVCDYGNDRVAVFDERGRFGKGRLLKSIAVRRPEQIQVHPRTGVIYVLCVEDASYLRKRLVNLGTFEEPGERYELRLPERPLHLHDPGPLLVLDSHAAEPVLWISCVGRKEPTDYLWKVKDDGKRFRRVTEGVMPRYAWPFGPAEGILCADKKRDELFVAGKALQLLRVEGKTGRMVELTGVVSYMKGTAVLPTDHPQVTAMQVDAAGLLYVRSMGAYAGMLYQPIVRYDRSGAVVPFAAGRRLMVKKTSHGYHMSGFCVDGGGNLWVMEMSGGSSPRGKTEYNVVNVYGPDGVIRQKEVVSWLSSGAWGIRLGPDGGVYLTEAIRPMGAAAMGVGSLLKFAPSGGRVVPLGEKDGAKYEVRLKDGRIVPCRIEGLEWLYYGVSPVPFGHCICASCRFDVDGFGRAFVPDAARYSVKVVDAHGRLAARFGAYGNRDSAEGINVPSIPFLRPNDVAVVGDAVYVYDSGNHRVLRILVSYEQTQVVTFSSEEMQ